jgi:tripartite-type tricarboxylate transporter receptor subunit TctC
MTMFDDPANRKRYDEGFYDIIRLSADEFAGRVRSDIARWERIVKETGIEAQ